METKYAKLSDLVESTFTAQRVFGFSFKKWNNEERRMERSDSWQEGFQKKWAVETDKGVIDFSSSQYGSMLEKVSRDGKADLIGWTFQVKSNGKTGMDIRYWLNPVRDQGESTGADKPTENKPSWQDQANAQSPTGPKFEDGAPLPDDDDSINLEDLPF